MRSGGNVLPKQRIIEDGAVNYQNRSAQSLGRAVFAISNLAGGRYFAFPRFLRYTARMTPAMSITTPITMMTVPRMATGFVKPLLPMPDEPNGEEMTFHYRGTECDPEDQNPGKCHDQWK